MAGVSNQPNIRPLIDKQTHAQTIEFKAVEKLIGGVLDDVDILKQSTQSVSVSAVGIKSTIDLEFAALKDLLSSEIDSSGDLTVANLASFKTAVVEEVQNSQRALNLAVSTNADAVLAGITGTDAKIDIISGELDNAKVSILSDVATTKAAIINAVNAAKTAVLNGVNSARINILTTVSGYITTAKNAIVSTVHASENRITANVNAKASGIKSVQRGVVTVTGVGAAVIISSVNLSKSTLIVSERGGVAGFLSAANKVQFEKDLSSSNYQSSGSEIVHWQVIEYV